MHFSKLAPLRLSPFYKWALAGFILALARLPFAATRHYQEDAFIVFRTAFNFADHGQLAFNLGESTSGATSLIYVLIVALLRALFGSATLNAVTVANTACVVMGAWLLAQSLETDKKSFPLWIAIGLLPLSLLVSYIGMDTAILLGVIALGAYGITFHAKSYALPLSTFMLPLVRPDALGFALIFTVGCFIIDRSRAIQAVLTLCLGVAILAGFNLITSGSIITPTVIAKELSYSHDRSPVAVVSRIIGLFLTNSYLLPVNTKYLEWLSPIATGITVIASVWSVRNAWHDIDRRFAILALVCAAYGIPIAYAYGGVIFPWYLWPSAWIAHSITLFFLLRSVSLIRISMRPALSAVIANGLFWCGLAQWMISYSIGIQEFQYRAEVGRYIASIARPTDTLFLEPAGFIPFFSKLKTWDEVGLVSPDILPFRISNPKNWWPTFVKAERPIWIVQRPELIDSGKTYQGYALTDDERTWLFAHYEVVRRFTYVPSDYASSWLGRKILSEGSHSGYDVLHFVPSATADP